MAPSRARYNTIVICGPTASGKTRLGVAVARHVEGAILSVDSRQVYRGMDIGSGKDLSEYGCGPDRVPYYLIDIAEPAEVYTLWRFQADFYAVWREQRRRGRMPVAVGGSGLYLEAVLKNYRVANVPENKALRTELMAQDTNMLAERLLAQDAMLYARSDRSSKKRLVRALEIAQAQRFSPTRWGHTRMPRIRPLVIGIRLQRELLRERIRQRLLKRLDGGMIDEVRALIERGVTAERLEQIGLEYRYVGRHVRGELSAERLREELYREICRFAKRQDTWFGGMQRRGTAIHWIEGDDIRAALVIIEAAFANAC